MAVCTNCKREIKDNHLYCGYCGVSQKPSVNVIIDGRKDKKIRYLINRVCHFEKINIMFSIAFLTVFIAGIFLLKSGVCDIIVKSGEFPEVAGQISAKYGYVKEGLGIEYLYRELIFVFNFIKSILIVITSVFAEVVSLFFLAFNVNILRLRYKYKENFYYKKPLNLIKFAFYAVKASFVVIAVLILLWLALAVVWGIIL